MTEEAHSKNYVRNAIRTLGEGREAIADMSRDVWGFVSTPSQWRPKMQEWALQRQDMSAQTRLNRQIRAQFMEAFNRSATKKLSVEINDDMKRYQSRNKVMSALLRPYEAFSYFNLPLKLVTAFAFFKGMRDLMAPVMGAWGVVVPLAAFMGSRMAVSYRNAENARQEDKFADAGMVIPCTFTVKNGVPLVAEHDIRHNHTVGFPLMHTSTPEWLMSHYDAGRKSLTKPETVHAAVCEATREGAVSLQDADAIYATFPQQPHLRDCLHAFAILFPAKKVDSLIAEMRALGEENVMMPVAAKETGLSAKFHAVAGATKEVSFPEAALKVLERFCQRGRDDAGLSALSGKVTLDDVRYLVELQTLGHAPDIKASDVTRMLKDPRFAQGMSFKQMVEAACLPEKQAAAFDDLWKDREYRTRFGYDLLRDMTLYAQGWGGVALRLARHDYTKSLTGAEIVELALPENQHWAKTYHKMRTTMPAETQGISHADLKTMVGQFGLATTEVLTRLKTAGPAANLNVAMEETRQAFGLAR